MKISYNWLKDYIDINLSPKELAERLTMVGLAVESVHPEGNDFLLDFDLTSNRPDAFSHFGICREISAITGNKAQLPEVRLNEVKERTADVTSVEILNTDLCPRYTARVIKDVKVGPSPEWLVKKLESVGQRSINNVADITNFVLWEQGQPLHAFDFDRLAGRRIVVRTARHSETLRTLDGVERKLAQDMLVIADAEKPCAMAGIMGGEYSEISAQTTNVLLESAYFQPLSVRRTARALDLNTEASYRFERGADPEACIRASNRCAELICELAGGQLLSGVVDTYPKPLVRNAIDFRFSRVAALTGLEADAEVMEKILVLLGFNVETLFRGERLRVVAPSFRVDISIEEDLVEEVVRHVGYDRIPLTLPTGSGAGNYLSGEERRRAMRDALIAQGFAEAITFSWVRPEVDAVFRKADTPLVTIQNPIDDERPQMRTSLLPGLIDSLSRNFNFGMRNVKLFELGKCYVAGATRPDEYERLAFLATGQRNEGDWQHNQEMIDLFDIKGAVEILMESCNLQVYKVERSHISYLHAGQSAQVVLNGKVIAVFGQLAPALRDEYKYKQPVYLAEIMLNELLSLPVSDVKYRPLPKLQAVSRDISMLISESVSYSEIENAIVGLGIKELLSIKLFDVYTGKNLPAGKRSLSLNLRYQPLDETMTDEQINQLDEKVVHLLAERFDAQLRR